MDRHALDELKKAGDAYDDAKSEFDYEERLAICLEENDDVDTAIAIALRQVLMERRGEYGDA